MAMAISSQAGLSYNLGWLVSNIWQMAMLSSHNLVLISDDVFSRLLLDSFGGLDNEYLFTA